MYVFFNHSLFGSAFITLFTSGFGVCKRVGSFPINDFTSREKKNSLTVSISLSRLKKIFSRIYHGLSMKYLIPLPYSLQGSLQDERLGC